MISDKNLEETSCMEIMLLKMTDSEFRFFFNGISVSAKIILIESYMIGLHK